MPRVERHAEKLPPGTVITPARRMTATDHKRILADIRNQLPVAEYLNVLHTLALTGQVPVFEPDPNNNGPPQFKGQFAPPDRVLQHKTLTYLIDKAFAPLEKPAAARAADQAGQQDDAKLLTSLDEARNLTVGDLLRRITTALPAPAEPEPEPADAQSADNPAA